MLRFFEWNIRNVYFQKKIFCCNKFSPKDQKKLEKCCTENVKFPSRISMSDSNSTDLKFLRLLSDIVASNDRLKSRGIKQFQAVELIVRLRLQFRQFQVALARIFNFRAAKNSNLPVPRDRNRRNLQNLRQTRSTKIRRREISIRQIFRFSSNLENVVRIVRMTWRRGHRVPFGSLCLKMKQLVLPRSEIGRFLGQLRATECSIEADIERERKNKVKERERERGRQRERGGEKEGEEEIHRQNRNDTRPRWSSDTIPPPITRFRVVESARNFRGRA